MRILKLTSIILIIFVFSNITCQASNTHSWYLIKKENAVPIFPSDAAFISEHKGIYIDEKSNKEGKKVIYLTFDAGYENGNVAKILDTLKEEGVTGAFFILSNLINKNPELVLRMNAEGHLVCNHTSDHKDISNFSENDILENLTRLENKYEACTGLKMEKIFRFPEGKYSKSAILTLEAAGYTTVFWSMAYDDWDNARQPSKDKAMKKLLGNTHEGAILLLHPTSSTNSEILPLLIKEWKKQGYTFGTLKDLCG